MTARGHDHDHDHDHGFGHSHDAADSIDDALEASAQGIRAVKISLVILLATSALQAAVVLVSGSVALFADTVHNFADALTAVPLWIAFVLGRRAATRGYTFGFGRAEDLAGLFIVVVVAISAVIAAWQAVDRLLNPRPLENIGWVLAAGFVGFLGNEAVAVYRIRIGRRIESAALVADGVHARTDGFTSLAVVLGAVGVMLGFPLADPIVGLLISVVIVGVLWGTARSVGRRLMDGIDPGLASRAETALAGSPGVVSVPRVQLRWAGHRLHVVATVLLEDMPLTAADEIVDEAEHQLRDVLPHLDGVAIRPVVSHG